MKSINKSEVKYLYFFTDEVYKEADGSEESEEVDCVDKHERGGVQTEKDGVFGLVTKVKW